MPIGKSPLVFGLHPVIEAIESGKELEKVFVQNNLQGPLSKELLFMLRERNIPFQYVPVEKLNRITTKNHQGVIAHIAEVTYHKVENLLPGIFEQGKTPLFVLLDQVTDVRNMGAIIRSAECTGADAVIIPAKGSAQINEETMKASAGALNLLPICRENSLAEALDFLKAGGLQAVACTEKAENTYTTADFSLPTVLVFGSEGSGISNEIMRMCDSQVRIPLMGKIESLNVSVSAAVVLYEAVRQRSGK
jgi:23S rRNA (guanosine2251-2'-O)-methyltransferase